MSNSTILFQGSYNATTNTPNLAALTNITDGSYWLVVVGGDKAPTGEVVPGDALKYSNNTWVKQRWSVLNAKEVSYADGNGTYPDVHTALDSALYKVPTVSVTNIPTYTTGQSITDASFVININKPMPTVQVTVGTTNTTITDVTNLSTTFTYTGPALTSTTDCVVTVTDSAGATDTTSFKIEFKINVLLSSGTRAAIPTTWNYKGNFPFVITTPKLPVGIYWYIAIPQAVHNPIITANGFNGGFAFMGEYDLTIDDVSIKHNIWRSANQNLNTTNIKVFK